MIPWSFARLSAVFSCCFLRPSVTLGKRYWLSLVWSTVAKSMLYLYLFTSTFCSKALKWFFRAAIYGHVDTTLSSPVKMPAAIVESHGVVSVQSGLWSEKINAVSFCPPFISLYFLCSSPWWLASLLSCFFLLLKAVAAYLWLAASGLKLVLIWFTLISCLISRGSFQLANLLILLCCKS